jgi:hypothetical protein
MKSIAAASRHRHTHIAVSACVAVSLMAGNAMGGGLLATPPEMTAFVHEGLVPGGTIFEDTHSATPSPGTPIATAQYLYLASLGDNLSGRSTQISRAFASSLAQNNGNGGVGVTAFIGLLPSRDPTAVSQLIARATWKQSITYNNTTQAPISVQLHIPAVQVGLIGVPPSVTSITNTETAEAKATLTGTITHPDGSTAPALNFEFGLRALEKQLPSGPQLFNVATFQLLGVTDSTRHLFDSFDISGPDSNPRFSLDSVSTTLETPVLQKGDTLSYVYELSAEGTTNGAEQGYVAFLGDPFGVDTISDNLVFSTASVPEPATWTLGLIAMACVIAAPRVRRAVLRKLSVRPMRPDEPTTRSRRPSRRPTNQARRGRG